MPPKISVQQVATLRAAFGRGTSTGVAAREAGVGKATSWNYFAAFASAGAKRPRRLWCSRYDPPLPLYDGPDWIGKAIDG